MLIGLTPNVMPWVEGWLPLGASSLVRETMERVSRDPRVIAALGRPVRARWSVVGEYTKDETGWTEGFLSIPISGPNGNGTVSVRAGRGTGRWVLSKLEFRDKGAAPVNLVDQLESAHRQAPTEPEFRRPTEPAQEPDGRYPCFLIRQPESDGLEIDARTTDCLPGLRNDRSYNEFEINLRYGFLVTRHTDLFIQDDMPLAFTRCFRMWDTISRAFGNGWNHPYDILPVGSRNPYSYVDILMPDGDPIHYERITEGTGYADAIYEHTATRTPFLHSQFAWNGDGWDLRFRDSGLFVFPENYSGTRAHHGAPTRMQDGRGHAVKFLRDRDRNLEQLISPSGRFIRLEHDSESRVTSAIDDRGRSVRYTYDDRGHLVTVTSGDSVVRYTYSGADLMAIEASRVDGAAETRAKRPLLQVRYAGRQVSGVELADGRLYRFAFRVVDRVKMLMEATVTAPDGTQTTVMPDGRR